MSWFNPTDRWPVPPLGEQPDDIRVTTAYAARTGALVDEIEALFQSSPEIATLRATYSDEVEVAMRMSSSRKYTTFEFPNCPGLIAGVLAIFARHGLDNDKPRLANHRDSTIQIGTLRIGPVTETIHFGAKRGASHSQ